MLATTSFQTFRIDLGLFKPGRRIHSLFRSNRTRSIATFFSFCHSPRTITEKSSQQVMTFVFPVDYSVGLRFAGGLADHRTQIIQVLGQTFIHFFNQFPVVLVMKAVRFWTPTSLPPSHPPAQLLVGWCGKKLNIFTSSRHSLSQTDSPEF